jgi:hypothetical protein
MIYGVKSQAYEIKSHVYEMPWLVAIRPEKQCITSKAGKENHAFYFQGKKCISRVIIFPC